MGENVSGVPRRSALKRREIAALIALASGVGALVVAALYMLLWQYVNQQLILYHSIVWAFLSLTIIWHSILGSKYLLSKLPGGADETEEELGDIKDGTLATAIVAEFIGVTFLVFVTGGTENSPFSPFILTMLVVGQFLANDKDTKNKLFWLGVSCYIVLFLLGRVFSSSHFLDASFVTGDLFQRAISTLSVAVLSVVIGTETAKRVRWDDGKKAAAANGGSGGK